MVRRKAPATGTPSCSKAAARKDGTRPPTTRDSTPEQAENDLDPFRSDEEDDEGEPRQRAFDAEDVYDQDILNMAIPPMPEPVMKSDGSGARLPKIVDKDNDFKIVHGSSFVVSRTAYRDNSSKYTYNGRTIPFEELAGKLRQVGIDVTHNRFLIHQEEMERIALMKPKAQVKGEEGMLEYLEKIIGSNRLKRPIRHLHDSIGKLQEERSALSKKNGLERPAKECLDYLNLENKITRIRNMIYQLEKHNKVVERDEKQSMIAEYERELDRVTKKLDEVLEKQNAKKDLLDKLQKDYNDELKNETEKEKRWTEMKSSKQNQTLEWKTRLEADIKAEQEKIKELEETLERAPRIVEEFREVIANAEKPIEDNSIEKDVSIAAFETETGDAKERERVLEEKLDLLAMAETQLTIAQDDLQTIGVDEDMEWRQSGEIRLLKEAAELGLTENKDDLEKAQRHLATVETELSARQSKLEQLKAGEAQVQVDTTKDTGKEMAAAERELEQDQSLLEQSRTELHESTVTELETVLEKTTDSIKNLLTQITDGEKRLTALEKRFADQAERLNAVEMDEKARATVQRRVEQCTRIRDAAAATAQEQREKVEIVAAEIQAIWDRLIGLFQKAIDAATATKTDGEKTITKEQSGANAAEGNLDEARTNLQKYETDLQMANKRIATLLIDNEELTTECQSVLAAMHNAQQVSMNKKRLLEEESKMNAELSDIVSGLQLEENEWQSKLNELKVALNEINAKIEMVDKLISQLKLHGNPEGIIRIDAGHSATKQRGDFLDDTEDDTSILNAACSSKESGRTSSRPNKQSYDEEGARNPNEAEQLISYGAEVIATWDSKGLADQLAELEQQKKGQKAPNQDIIKHYKRKVDKYERLIAELDAISSRRDKHRRFYDLSMKKRMNQFMDGFVDIGLALKEVYRMITLGGDVALDSIDLPDPFSKGIDFQVCPPKKSWKRVANLSGGEKTLSSLALIFALHSYKPIPLYVIDGIDAAPDFHNVIRYVMDHTKNAQFIFIQSRNDMAGLGDRQVDINQAHDSTYNVVIDPGVDENKHPADTAHTSQISAASEANAANV